MSPLTNRGTPATGHALRESFLRFFEERGHVRVRSAPIIPHDDPTLLFTNAGMNQFKDIFLGQRAVPYPRAASVQKCLRAGGKHNDLENVGFTLRHHTFFEMLGNWSFGDYGKREAVEWAWEYVTKELGLPPARLHASVFREDDEAYDLWAKRIGLPASRIARLGEKDNFWAMGDTGPCGPCSEIHFDQGAGAGCGKSDCGPDCDCGRFLEIWNLVFMELNKTEAGEVVALPMKNVDTGMGLERALSLLQDVPSNFDTDLFEPIFDRIERDSKKPRGDAQFVASFRVIGDHLRALAFSIADGALPGNEGRGYVLRRILRRAVRHARKLGLGKEGAYLWTLVEPLRGVMGETYPELAEHDATIQRVIRTEEESFARTIDRGLGLFEKVAADAAARSDKTIAGEAVFQLYDTYGFPVDLTAVMARERGLVVDEAGFERAMEAQRERSRAGGDFKRQSEEEWIEAGGDAEALGVFERHAPQMRLDGAKILRYREASAALKEELGEPCVEIVLDRTPFYAEAGGQVGDTGRLRLGGRSLEVLGTEATPRGNAHRVRATRADVEAALSRPIGADVDVERRRAIMRNHTATHLLHAALRGVLGTHVTQAGSLVAPDRLRFDFQHFEKMTREQIDSVERRVSDEVRRVDPVRTDETTYDEARKQGAMALFGEKYGDRVRMVSIGGDPPFSRELCGGTHCADTGEIADFVITQEASVAAGVRRVEALTGAAAGERKNENSRLLAESAAVLSVDASELPGRTRELMAAAKGKSRPSKGKKDGAAAATDDSEIGRAQRTRELLEETAGLLSVTPAELPERLRALVAAAKEKAASRERAESAGASASIDSLLRNAIPIGGARLVATRVEAGSLDELKAVGDALRGCGEAVVAVLAGEWGGKLGFVAVATDDLVARGVHAGKLVGEVATETGGRGGGKPTFAQAGGKDPAKLDSALGRVEELVRHALGA